MFVVTNTLCLCNQRIIKDVTIIFCKCRYFVSGDMVFHSTELKWHIYWTAEETWLEIVDITQPQEFYIYRFREICSLTSFSIMTVHENPIGGGMRLEWFSKHPVCKRPCWYLVFIRRFFCCSVYVQSWTLLNLYFTKVIHWMSFIIVLNFMKILRKYPFKTAAMWHSIYKHSWAVGTRLLICPGNEDSS